MARNGAKTERGKDEEEIRGKGKKGRLAVIWLERGRAGDQTSKRKVGRVHEGTSGGGVRVGGKRQRGGQCRTSKLKKEVHSWMRRSNGKPPTILIPSRK